jgi:hypothetical protein
VEIQHATLAQVRDGRDGKRVLVEEDVLDIARQIRQIDPSLDVYWNEYGEHFVITETLKDGTEKLVTTALELDQRLIAHLRMLIHPDYDYGREIDRMDDQAEKDKDHEFAEQVGPLGEKLAHALRKDLQVKSRIYVPERYGAA